MPGFEKKMDPEGDFDARAFSISAIVPAHNEASGIVDHLRLLRDSGAHEIIVVDGGSDDGTLVLAKEHCDQVCVETGGLAHQLNRGAWGASGEVLFFPYADTQLPPEWARAICRVLSSPRVVGGSFRLGFDSERRCFRMISSVANARARLGIGPLGDQALFVRRRVFERLGGFRTDVLLEDLDFVRRLRREGKVVVSPEPVRSSVRRWEENGVLPTMLRNWNFLAQHLIGLNGEGRRLAYRKYRVESH